jgi:hypothetical protein
MKIKYYKVHFYAEKYGIQSTCLLNQVVWSTTNEAIKGKLTINIVELWKMATQF